MQENVMCEKHNEILKLFCEDDHTAICLVCRESRDHKCHSVLPIQEAASDYKVKCQSWLDSLKLEMEASLDKKSSETKRYDMLRSNLEAEKTASIADFEVLHQRLNQAELTLYQRIKEMMKKISIVENANISKLSDEISALEMLIAEIETKCKKPAVDFLKDVKSVLRRCSDVKFQNPEAMMNIPKELPQDLQQTSSIRALDQRGVNTPPLLPSQATPPQSSFFQLRMQQGLNQSPQIRMLGPTNPHLHLLPQAPSPQDPLFMFARAQTSSAMSGSLIEDRRSSFGIFNEQDKRSSSPAENESQAKQAKITACGLATENRNVTFIKEMMEQCRAIVTMDPDTANPSVDLCKDGRRLSNTGTVKYFSENDKRFVTHPCVLGSEGFTSGSHYWEVEVLKVGDGWSVGVAAESVKRNGRITQTPYEGILAVGKGGGKKFVAFSCPCTPLPLNDRLRKLGVYLDFEGGHLALYNADTMDNLYIFNASFTQKMFPYFHVKYKAELMLI